MSNNLNYEVTLRAAEQRFCQRSVEEIPELTGATLGDDGNLHVKFLTTIYSVSPQGKVFLPDSQEDVPLTLKILLLHYLAQGSIPKGNQKLISFKELPGGNIYIEPFTNRAIRPMIVLFGGNPQALIEVGKKLAGTVASVGDASITLLPFPRVPVTFVLWGGDEEFPPSGNILFDISAAEYLPTEDYAVLASLLVAELRRNKG